MQLLDNVHSNDDRTLFYLPHHCVFKETSTTTKLRVVFDGSCKSESGTSLNDILMVGPVVQSDLITLLARFRTFKYVFTADVVKMYRQILIDYSQTSLQCILWRENIAEPVRTYELKTITYGTASAPYLATRCLKYLAELYQNDLPIGSRAIIDDVYVDDLLTGAHSLVEAMVKRDQIIAIMSKGCFTLDKWFSNCNELLKGISYNCGQNCVSINESSETRILGLQWNPYEDSFRYTVNVSSLQSNSSKRNMLSEISRLFDPLGLIGPVILIAKLMIQDLWKLHLDWDESVPLSIHSRWLEYKTQISGLSELRIPRMIGFTADALDVQFHGFADASQRTYALLLYCACCYIRIGNAQRSFQTRLLASKSRVAPSKAVSLPRLELCAALLLTQLQDKLLKAINIQSHKTYFWTDSTIALSWIKAYSRKFTVFVSNRIGEIQRLTKTSDWHHGSTKCNSADMISRGIMPQELIKSSLWWNGPEWLSSDESGWPDYQSQCVESLPDQLKQQHFSQEIHDLKQLGELSNTSRLLPLNPFIDKNGILRVGGRLKNADMSYKIKHPILLPKDHTITKLVIRNEHIKNLHAGIQATMYAVRNKFWPISIKVTTRNIIKNCVTCFKLKPSMTQTIMSDLPRSRVNPSHPFAHTGLDFGGPFAVHIELVADLSSEAFLGALKRFIARRGKVSCLYSDNGTNFVGASRELNELHKMFTEEQVDDDPDSPDLSIYRQVRGKGTHSRKAPQSVRGKGTTVEKHPNL
ncbi:PREDICTED: uncharacterized protein LOC105449144 [Wasmannia auropunctata]|uniref:uncharacterized protein LOC105449144 n=1 Tax=Wasmannia auropunctata TaxID=64793 RepID=UPI0005F07BAB|nr:PREDICTED: uncharacterized protein LOC105449144 [Wasmannia auropunctata]